MIVTRGLGLSTVRSALVAAGLCISVVIGQPPAPMLANVLFVNPEVRIVKEATVAEQRIVILSAEARKVTVVEAARQAAVSSENRVLVISV